MSTAIILLLLSAGALFAAAGWILCQHWHDSRTRLETGPIEHPHLPPTGIPTDAHRIRFHTWTATGRGACRQDGPDCPLLLADTTERANTVDERRLDTTNLETDIAARHRRDQ